MEADAALDAAYRQHWGRLLALLVGQYRRLDLAEDALSGKEAALAGRCAANAAGCSGVGG